MEEEKIQIGINQIRNTKMTSEEKEHIFKNVLSSPILIEKPIKSPYSFASLFQKNFLVYYGMAVCLIVVVISSKGMISTYFQNQNTQNSEIAKIDDTRPIDMYSANYGTSLTSPTSPDTSLSTSPTSTNTNPSTLTKNPTDNIQDKKSIGDNIYSGEVAKNYNQGFTSGAPATAPNININDTDSQKYTNIASEAFTKWFEQLAQEKGNVLDYRINKIDFVVFKANAEDKYLNWFDNDTSQNAFIVTVDYSVKTTLEGKKSYWSAENGIDSADGWIVNKSLFVTIEKGNNGYFVKSVSTGL